MSQAKIETSLLAYVIDYLREEQERMKDMEGAVNGSFIKDLVQEALDAYAAGAR